MKKSLSFNGVLTELGTEDYVNAFFATIHTNLEGDGEWGSKYPILLNELYSGMIRADQGAAALDEINDIYEKFRSLAPSDVVWEFDGRIATPPCGDKARSDVVDLSNFFTTKGGRDLIGKLRKSFETMIRSGGDMEIISMDRGALGALIAEKARKKTRKQ